MDESQSVELYYWPPQLDAEVPGLFAHLQQTLQFEGPLTHPRRCASIFVLAMQTVIRIERQSGPAPKTARLSKQTNLLMTNALTEMHFLTMANIQ